MGRSRITARFIGGKYYLLISVIGFAMEIHQLRYFLAVVRTRNFSRAAEQCHVTQPSLSQQIKKLEDELGERLFARTKREVVVTPAGELFSGHANRVLEEIEQGRE